MLHQPSHHDYDQHARRGPEVGEGAEREPASTDTPQCKRQLLPHQLNPAQVVALQRTLGNQAVVRLLQRQATPAPQTVAPAALLVEDDAGAVQPAQMRKTEFLNQLREAVCAAADEELAAAGRDTNGCPYVSYWFHPAARGRPHYAQRDAPPG